MKKRLIDIFPLMVGVFSGLDSYDVPWKNDIDYDILDLEYFGNISGNKFISPLLNKMLEDDGTITENNLATICKLIWQMNGINWVKSYATLNFEYNPIENYSMSEQMTNDITTIGYGHTNTRTDNTTETETPNVKNESKTGTFGFNSSEASDANSSEQTVTGTTQRANTGTVGNVESGTDTHTRNYTLTRSGNIGVTTSQQMLQSERDLWIWNFFYNRVFPDIDRILTLAVY